MIFKTQHVRAPRYTPQKARSFLHSHLKYLQYRDRSPQESKEDRRFFSANQEHIGWRPVAGELMQENRAGDIYYHRMIFSPADNEPVTDWQAWTRAIMSDLEARFGKSLNWYATHHQNTAHPHIHVIMRGTGLDRETGRTVPVSLNPQDFKFLREKGREYSEYEQQRFLEETLHSLQERDTISQELAQVPGQRNPQRLERDADFDR